MIVLTLFAAHAMQMRAKRCGTFDVGGQTQCGPSLFIVGLGKCGTNAFAAYLMRHPLVRLTKQSEVQFDPALVEPEEFVALHGGNSTAADEYVLVAKSNLDPYQDPVALVQFAQRLRLAYPEAAVGLTLCDPMWHPWRWFRHYVTAGFVCARNGSRTVLSDRILNDQARRFGMSLVEAYQAIDKWRSAAVLAHCGGAATPPRPPIASAWDEWAFSGSWHCLDRHALSNRSLLEQGLLQPSRFAHEVSERCPAARSEEPRGGELLKASRSHGPVPRSLRPSSRLATY